MSSRRVGIIGVPLILRFDFIRKLVFVISKFRLHSNFTFKPCWLVVSSVAKHPEWKNVLKKQQVRIDCGIICENHFKNENKQAKRNDLKRGAMPFFEEEMESEIEVAVEIDGNQISQIELLNDDRRTDLEIEVAVEIDDNQISQIEISSDKPKTESEIKVSAEGHGDQISQSKTSRDKSCSNADPGLQNEMQLELLELRAQIFHLNKKVNNLSKENKILKSEVQLRGDKIENFKKMFFDEETDKGKMNAILEALRSDEYLSVEAADALKVSFIYVLQLTCSNTQILKQAEQIRFRLLMLLFHKKNSNSKKPSRFKPI